MALDGVQPRDTRTPSLKKKKVQTMLYFSSQKSTRKLSFETALLCSTLALMSKVGLFVTAQIASSLRFEPGSFCA